MYTGEAQREAWKAAQTATQVVMNRSTAEAPGCSSVGEMLSDLRVVLEQLRKEVDTIESRITSVLLPSGLTEVAADPGRRDAVAKGPPTSTFQDICSCLLHEANSIKRHLAEVTSRVTI